MKKESIAGWVAAFLLIGSLAYAQVPMFMGTRDYLINWVAPAAQRTLTIVDPGGNDSFVFASAAQTFSNKGIARPAAAGSAATLGTCANAAIDATSTDFAGRVTFSGANSTCQVTFSASWGSNAPVCVLSLSGATTTPGAMKQTTTATSMTIVPASAFANTDAVSYICVGRG